MKTREDWMQQALNQADKAAQQDEVPIGAIVVHENQIIGAGYNQPIRSNDPSAHAEVIAIRQAADYLANYRLLDCELYTTLEPCPMCAGLMIYSRIKTCIYAASDSKAGAAGSVVNLFAYPFNHRVEVVADVCADIAAEKLKSFFQAKRTK
ncbi:MAG: tRNA adenosine(34) deaminase TadA [Pseudomonadota bacterium]